MAQLSSDKLLQVLLAACPPGTKVLSLNEGGPKPAVLSIPSFGVARIYLWTTTPDRSVSGRPVDEHKSQIIIPGTKRSARQELDLSAMPTYLVGFSPVFSVFVFWDPRKHRDSAYSKNLQVKENLLDEATASGWSVDDPRITTHGPEVRASAHPAHFLEMLKAIRTADKLGLEDVLRQTYLTSQMPAIRDFGIGRAIEAGESIELAEVERQREETVISRLKRSRAFSPKVLGAFEGCAVCSTHLSILDGAHIVPAHHPKGSDELWNGLAMCKNHHALYDKRILLIDGSATLRIDGETIALLKEVGRLGGFETQIKPFVDRPIQRPKYYRGRADFRDRFHASLKFNFELSAH